MACNREEEEDTIPNNVILPSRDYQLNVFIDEIAQEISNGELNRLKNYVQGEAGIGLKTLEKIKTPLDFFNCLRRHDGICLNRFNLLYLQSMLWHLKRRDLHAKAVIFARKCRNEPLYFFTPPAMEDRDLTHVHVQFHIGGKGERLTEITPGEVEGLRNLLSELLCVPKCHVTFVGLQPFNSLIVTFSIPADLASILFELSGFEKSLLKTKKVDFFSINEERVNISDEPLIIPIALKESDQIKKIMQERDRLAKELDTCRADLMEVNRRFDHMEKNHRSILVRLKSLPFRPFLNYLIFNIGSVFFSGRPEV